MPVRISLLPVVILQQLRSDLATVTATASGGTGGPYTYQWSNGFTNPTQTVGPGTYIVTVSDGMCSATDTVVIQYISFPTAAFTASSACLNQVITFTFESGNYFHRSVNSFRQ